MTRAGLVSLILALAAPAYGEESKVADAIGRAKAADIVIVGEVHDNPAHHRVQAEFAAELRPAAIVFEMLAPDQAPPLMALRADGATIEAQSALLDWDKSGWPPFDQYAPIMDAAPQAALYGAHLPSAAVRAAFEKGAAQVFKGDTAQFGLAEPLDAAEQAEREEMQFDAHCQAMPRELMPGMVEAQRLRDAALSQQIVKALAENGAPVLVITGNGHADRGWGIPALLGYRDEASIFVFGQFEAAPARQEAFDAWHITPAVERGDPCAAFR